MKIEIYLFIIIILSNFCFAINCNDYNMNVYKIQKQKDCFNHFNSVFEHIDCEYNCFLDVKNYLVFHENEIIHNISSKKTSFFGIYSRNINCSVKNVTMVLEGSNGSCSKQFNLEEEYQKQIQEEIERQELIEESKNQPDDDNGDELEVQEEVVDNITIVSEDKNKEPVYDESESSSSLSANVKTVAVSVPENAKEEEKSVDFKENEKSNIFVPISFIIVSCSLVLFFILRKNNVPTHKKLRK